MNNDIVPPKPPDPLVETDLFRTPDDVAAGQNLEPSPPVPPPSKGGWREKLQLHWPPGRKEWLVVAGVAVLSVLLIGGWIMTHPEKKPVVHKTVKQAAKAPAVPKTVPSTLSGLQVDASLNLRPVTGVMIENSMAARPQSGLSQAGVVFEAIAEGGITRFLALYQDTAPEDVGPIRSARPYYIHWAMGFDAAYAHVGGSPEALASIKNWGVRDLDQFANSGSYHRIGTRAAPHNVYTSIGVLHQLEQAKGYTSSTFTGFARKKKEEPSKLPTAKTVNLAISGALYNVHYDYDPATNTYHRSQGGAGHIDANGNVLITPKVVIALVMSYGVAADHHSQYGTIGTGQAYVFQDGNVVIGNWTKATDKSQIVFIDAAGKPLTINPGQTWLTAIANAGAVSYAP